METETVILRFAKGQPCTVRLPGVCRQDKETCVMAHVPNGLRYGKGMGHKPSDLLVAIACHSCHDVLDGRVRSAFGGEFLELCFWRGHGETLVKLEKAGMVKA